MEKYVIFDWGGVILHEFGDTNCDRDAINKTFKKFNPDLTEEEIWDVYISTCRDENNTHLAKQNDKESFYKYFDRIKEKGKFNCTYEEFVNEFSNNFINCDTYKEVEEFIYSLKGKVKLCLFSDLIFVFEHAIRSHVNFDVFDRVFLSFVEGIHKSEVSAFEYVENDLGVTGEQILFVDNMERNINNAKARNWNTCQAFGYEIDRIKETVNKFIEEE